MEVKYLAFKEGITGVDYPRELEEVIVNREFDDPDWVKENGLVAIVAQLSDFDEYGLFDMGIHLTAPLSWVEDNCPSVLQSQRFIAPGAFEQSGFGNLFLKYTPENIGLHRLGINFGIYELISQ